MMDKKYKVRLPAICVTDYECTGDIPLTVELNLSKVAALEMVDGLVRRIAADLPTPALLEALCRRNGGPWVERDDYGVRCR